MSEPYIRQTFRNRCEILTSQGVQKLSVPIDKKSTQSGTIKDVKIDYAENWQRQHWRSFQASYNNSPYFLYYRDELQRFYEKRWGYLVEFNAELLTFILNKMRITRHPERSEGSASEQNRSACRKDISKQILRFAQDDRSFTPFRMTTKHRFKPYQQVFGEAFVPNLSSLDLLFNCGPESKAYLSQS